MKKNIGILIIITIFVSFYFAIYGYNNNKQIAQVVSYNNFNIITSEINSYALFSKKYMNSCDMKKLADDILLSLDIQGETIDNYNKNQNGSILTVKRPAKSSDTIITIKSIAVDDYYETYVCIDVVLYSDFTGIENIKILLRDIYSEYNTNPEFNSLTINTLDGSMSSKQCKETIDNLCDIYNIKVYERYENDDVYSITGYTRYFDDYIISNNKKINANIGLNYNECEDKMYMYFATPIITIEY